MQPSSASRDAGVQEEQTKSATKKIQLERFSIVTTRPFDEVIAHIKRSISLPNLTNFLASMRKAQSIGELESTVQEALGAAGLMLFLEFDHGDIVRKGTGRDAPQIVRLVIGNPLIMKQMAKHVPDAGAYAPVTVLVDQRDDGVHLSYDRMASLLAPYESPEALEVARSLDMKVEELLRQAAGSAHAD
jgi:uncharacterized protein (DUF302 family)